MADQFDKAFKWLGRQRRNNATERVYYFRGPDSIRIRATIGQTEFQRDDGSGVAVAFHSTDFILDAADLVFDGVRVTPQRGDRVVRGSLTDGTVFELLNDVAGQPWKYSDPGRRVFRIHTKQTGTLP